MTTEEWMADIGRACDDLGYGVLAVKPGQIKLSRLRSHADITLRSPFLSGEFLRNVLVPVPKEEPTEVNE